MEFRNFIYEFNSLIDLNDFGGYVVITNSKFVNFNTCGALIRNKKYILKKPKGTITTYE